MTIDDIAAELYERGQDAEVHALTLIRCVDYDRALTDDAARMAAVRTILNAMDRARERRLADLQATCAAAQAELDRLRAELTGGAR